MAGPIVTHIWCEFRAYVVMITPQIMGGVHLHVGTYARADVLQ